MDHARPLAAISDDELLRRLVDLVRQSRRVESDLVAHIAEVERRRLYAREASPSMFVYCTQVLRLSEAEAYARITVARASREHPMLLDMLTDGRLHLTGVARLAPHLTPENRGELLERATHKSRRQIEELIADIAPRPDAAALMRRLPERRDLAAQAVPAGAGATATLARPQLCLDRVERGALTLTPDPDSDMASADPAPGEAEATQQAATSVQASAAVPPAEVVGRPAVAQSTAVVHTRGPADIQPLGRARYKVQFTASAELHDKLERLRALMRSQVPDGDLAVIIDMATSRRPSGERCTSVTAADAATSMRRAGDARSATVSSTTIDIRSAWAETTA
jgi:hypothetical protein